MMMMTMMMIVVMGHISMLGNEKGWDCDYDDGDGDDHGDDVGWTPEGPTQFRWHMDAMGTHILYVTHGRHDAMGTYIFEVTHGRHNDLRNLGDTWTL